MPEAKALPPGSVAINCGGAGAGHFVADEDFAGGDVHVNSTGPVDRRVPNPAPEDVYHCERSGDFSYTIPGLTPGGHYQARLHFTEDYWTQAGQRVFDVMINGQPSVTHLDIFRESGGQHKALIKEVAFNADRSGKCILTFKTVTNNAKVDAIEIIPATQS